MEVTPESHPKGAPASVGHTPELFRQLARDTKRLIELEARLCRLEARALGLRIKHGVLFTVLGASAALVSLNLMGLALGTWLATSTDLPAWGANLASALVFAVFAVAGFFWARYRWFRSTEGKKDGTRKGTPAPGNRRYPTLNPEPGR